MSGDTEKKRAVSEIMSGDEMRAAIVRIAGGDGHGYIKAAAASLDVTPRTINNAMRGAITASFSEKVRAALREIEHREADENIFGQAGVWSVGGVEDRQTGTDVFDEAVVTRLKSPVFILHAAMVRGVGDDGDQIWEHSVRWLEQPSSDEVGRELVRVAKEKAAILIYQRMEAVAQNKIRAIKERVLRRAGLSDEEMRILTSTELSAEASIARHAGKGGTRATLQDLLPDLEARLADISRRVLETPGDTKAYLELGYTRAVHRMTLVALKEENASVHSAHMAVVAYDNLPQADLRNERGQREAKRDAQEMQDEVRNMIRDIDHGL